MCLKKFVIAPLNKVSSIRYRKSSKGSNQGENELELLKSMQASGLFDFSVHCATGTNMIVVYKKLLFGASVNMKISINSELTKIGVSLDEYVANSTSGIFDVPIVGLPALVLAPIPYGLNSLKVSSESDVLDENAVSPVATQDRRVPIAYGLNSLKVVNESNVLDENAVSPVATQDRSAQGGIESSPEDMEEDKENESSIYSGGVLKRSRAEKK
jgi:hypothetical protein